MEQKHSDDLFRDKLADYSPEPDPKVWDRIERSLDQRKSRRIVPIWWRLGGVAAVLALGFYLLLPDGTSATTDLPAVTEQPVENPAESRPGRAQDLPATSPDATSVAGTETPGEAAESQSSGASDATGHPVVMPLAGEAPLGGLAGKTDTPASEPASKRVKNKPFGTNMAGSRGSGNTKTVVAERAQRAADADNTVVAGMEPVQEKGEQQAISLGQKRGEGDTPAGRAAAESGLPSETALQPANTDLAGAEERASQDQKQSIYEAIEAQEALSETTQKDARWTIGPSLAPVYFDSFGDGSPIAQNFVPNSKTGAVNMSYGLSVSYAINKKLSLRSGVHRVDFGYDTDQVSFSSTLNARPSSLIQTISYSENSKNVVVHSTAGNTAPVPDQNPAADVTAPSPERQGSMEQEFGYLEVPFEVQYALLDRRFGVNVIGGMSSLFLVDNRVSLNSLGARTEIGEARNINAVNFSGNFGLGFYYNLNTALQLNMQPMFKYHLNTFSETAGAFRPFSVGVYSGLSFRF